MIVLFKDQTTSGTSQSVTLQPGVYAWVIDGVFGGRELKLESRLSDGLWETITCQGFEKADGSIYPIDYGAHPISDSSRFSNSSRLRQLKTTITKPTAVRCRLDPIEGQTLSEARIDVGIMDFTNIS